MPELKSSILFTIGAATSGSFASTLGQAAGDLKALGKEMAALDKQRAKLASLGDLRAGESAAKAKRDAAVARATELARQADDATARLKAAREERSRMARLAKKGFEPVDAGAKSRVAGTIEAAQRDLELLRVAESKNRKEVAALTKEQNKLGAELARTEAYLHKNAVATDKVSESEAKLVKQHARLAAQRRRDEARGALDSAQDKFKDGLFGSFGIGKAVALATVGSLLAIGKSTADTADEVGGLAARVGMTTQALQEFQYAGMQNNIGADEMGGLMEKFTLRLHDAALGGGEAGDAIRRLGLDARQLAASDPDDAIMALAGAFEKVPGAGERAALSVALFGKEGVKMGALLNGGSKELARLRDEAHRMGYVMDFDLVEAGKRFDASQKKLGASLVGVRNIIGAALLPALSDAADAFAGALLSNGDDFRDLAKQLGETVREVAPSLVSLAKGVLSIGVAIAQVVGPVFAFIDKLGLWPVIIGALAGGYIVSAIGNLWAMGVATWNLVSAQAALNAVDGTSWASKAGRAWGALKNIGGTLASLLPGIATWLSGAWAGVSAFFVGAASTIGSAIVSVFTSVPAMIIAAFAAGFGLGKLLLLFKPVQQFCYAIGDLITWVWDKITGLGDAIAGLWEKGKKLFGLGKSDTKLGKANATKLVATPKVQSASDGSISTGAPWAGNPNDAVPPGDIGTAVPKAGTEVAMSNVPEPATAHKAVSYHAPITVTVNAAPGQSPEVVARRAAELVEMKQRAASRNALHD